MKKQTSPTAVPAKKPVPAAKELVSITELKVGDRFILQGKRKEHTIKKIIELKARDEILFVLEDRCKQIVFKKGHLVFKIPTPTPQSSLEV